MGTELLLDERGERADELRIVVRHLDSLQRHSQLARPLLRLDVDVPANLQMIRHEADRADEHVAHAVCMQLVEVLEDVRAEPRLACRRFALIRERPVFDAGAFHDQRTRLEQLLLIRIPSLEDARRQRMRGEDDIRAGPADSVCKQLDEIVELLGRDRTPAADVRVVGRHVLEPLGRAVCHQDDRGAHGSTSKRTVWPCGAKAESPSTNPVTTSNVLPRWRTYVAVSAMLPTSAKIASRIAPIPSPPSHLSCK